MMHAGEFPGHLDIGAGLMRMLDIFIPGGFGPAVTRFEIQMPVNGKITIVNITPDLLLLAKIGLIDSTCQP